MRRPLITIAMLLALASAAWADEAGSARTAMRDAAIEKAEVTPPVLPSLAPPDPLRPPTAREVAAVKSETRAEAQGKPETRLEVQGKPGVEVQGKLEPRVELQVKSDARLEVHRLVVEAAAQAAGSREDAHGPLVARGARGAPAPRAADNNASAQGQAQSAAAVARAGDVRRMGGGNFPPGHGGNGNGNGNGGVGNGNGNGNGKR